MAGFNHPGALAVLRDIQQQPSYPVYQRAEARLSQLDGLAQLVGPRRVRIAVLSSFTIDPIRPYLRVGCLERDVWADIFIPAFNQFTQQLLTPQSELYLFQPDVCFLHVPPEALAAADPSGGLTASQVEPTLEAVRTLVRAFRSHGNGHLVIANFAAPAWFPYWLQEDETSRVCALLNDGLRKIAEETSGVHILDYERLSAYHGKESVADARLRHIARMEIGDKFLPKLATMMLGYVIALRGFSRKCVVLDLDNTLWGGVVGEEGPAGIHLGPEFPGSAFVEFQQSLLALHRRGVILAINSRNNEADALEVLREHPAMVLRSEHFAAMQINWRDKSQNIEDIARQLNLGLEAMVFIDDSPVERDLMRRHRPEVLTPEWPSDPVLYRAALESMCDFATLAVTQEDLARGTMYAAEAERETFKKRSDNLEGYLFGLGMEVRINRAERGDLARVHQLIHKTNQFNLTTRRHSAADLEAFLSKDETLVYVLRNRDMFGDNGLVGVAILVRENEEASGSTWRIDSLLMSCRVLGRTIETGFLQHLLEALKSRGCRTVIGEFVPTKKNGFVKDFYAEAGFQKGRERDGAVESTLDLSTYVPRELPWLDVKLVESPS